MLKEATALGKAGYEVVVVGVRNHPASESLDADLLRSAPFRLESLNLLPGGGPASFLARLEVKFRRELAARGIWKSIGALGPARALLRAAERRPADLTICHNEIAHWAGVRLLDRGRRVAADIEDWHSEDLLPEARENRPLALLRAQESRLLRRGVYTSTTSAALAQELNGRYGGMVPVVIPNAFPLCSPEFNSSEASGRMVWFSQTIGPGRGLEAFIKLWGSSGTDGTVTLIGHPVSTCYLAKLRFHLPENHRDRLKHLPLVPPNELSKEVAKYDLGLALEPSFPRNKHLTISNKILQYLSCGLGVLATRTLGQMEVLKYNPNAGLLLELSGSEGEARELKALLTDSQKQASIRGAAAHLAKTRYCWEIVENDLLQAVRRALTSK